MASISSIISLIVVLLAAYAYAAPVISESETSTTAFDARQETSDVSQRKRGNETVGLSSSESDSEETTQTTGKMSERDFEDSSVSSFSETNMERAVKTDGKESSVVTEDERTVTEDFLSTENTKRGMEVESFESSTIVEETTVPSTIRHEKVKRSLNQPWLAPESEQEAQKRSIEIVESSTDVEETSVPSTNEINKIERSFDESSSLTEETTQEFNARAIGSVETDESSTIVEETSFPSSSQVESVKRSLNQPWLAPESDQETQKRSIDIVESSTDVEETSVPSTSEISKIERSFDESSPLTTGASEEFNKRAITVMKPKKQDMAVKRDTDMEQPSSSSDNDSNNDSNKRAVASVESVVADESSTVISVKILSESTTEEQPSSSSTVEYVETTEAVVDESSSSTSEYDTTVVPVEESTSASSVPRESTPKILAIIPGQISKSRIVVQPATQKPVVIVRPIEQVQLSQVTHETIVEEKKPHN